MNRFNAIGRLVRDSELRMTVAKAYILNFTLAVNSNNANKDGEYKTSYIPCRLWGKAAEALAKYLVKGLQVGIEGEISTGSYEKDGAKRYTTEILVTKIELLGGKKAETQKEESKVESKEDPYAAFGEEIEISEKDLPF